MFLVDLKKKYFHSFISKGNSLYIPVYLRKKTFVPKA